MTNIEKLFIVKQASEVGGMGQLVNRGLTSLGQATREGGFLNRFTSKPNMLNRFLIGKGNIENANTLGGASQDLHRMGLGDPNFGFEDQYNQLGGSIAKRWGMMGAGLGGAGFAANALPTYLHNRHAQYDQTNPMLARLRSWSGSRPVYNNESYMLPDFLQRGQNNRLSW